MQIYVASKTIHLPFWQALRAAGVPIVASWIDWPGNSGEIEPTSDEWSEHWQRCLSEASEADVTLLCATEGERQMGALLECGAALAAGTRGARAAAEGLSNWCALRRQCRCRVLSDGAP